MIVILLKLLDFAENLHSEKFDGAEFIFVVILTPRKCCYPCGGDFNPKKCLETPYENLHSE